MDGPEGLSKILLVYWVHQFFESFFKRYPTFTFDLKELTDSLSDHDTRPIAREVASEVLQSFPWQWLPRLVGKPRQIEAAVGSRLETAQIVEHSQHRRRPLCKG